MRKTLPFESLRFALALFLCLLMGIPLYAQTHRLYVAEQTASGSRVFYTNDGSMPAEVLTVSGTVQDLVVDPANGFVFWIEGDAIYKTDLELNNRVTVVSGLSGASALAVDIKDGLLYLIRQSGSADELYHVKYDGSQLSLLYSFGASAINMLEFSQNRQTLYLSSAANSRIYTFLPSTGTVSFIPAFLSNINDLSLDDTNNTLYYSRSDGRIGKINTSTNTGSIVYSGLGEVACVSLNHLKQSLRIVNDGEVMQGSVNGSSPLSIMNVGTPGQILALEAYANEVPEVISGNIDIKVLEEDFGSSSYFMDEFFKDDHTLTGNLDFQIVASNPNNLFTSSFISGDRIRLISKTNAYGEAWFLISARDKEGLAAQDTLFVKVNPVMDPPGIGAVFTFEDVLTDIISVDPVLNDQPTPTYYKVYNISNGTLYRADGVTPINEGDFLPVTEAHQGFRFMTDENSVISGSFTVKSSTTNNDSGLGGDSIQLALPVIPVNDEPTFTKGSNITIAEDSGPYSQEAWASGMSPGPADESWQNLTFFVQADNTSLFSVQPQVDAGTGDLIFTPAEDANGMTEVTVWLEDNGDTDPPLEYDDHESQSYTFTITIEPVNDPPVSGDFTLTTFEDTPVPFNYALFAPRFIDVDGDSIQKIRFTDLPLNGTLFLNELRVQEGEEFNASQIGQLMYIPDEDYNGTDRFSWQGHDGTLYSAEPGLVDINVMPVNDAPLAIDDEFIINEDEVLDSSVVVNDSGLGDKPIVVTVITSPAHGTLQLNSDGSFTYTPDADYFGEDLFTYEVVDDDGESSGATASITIKPINDEAPLAIDDFFTTNEDEALTENVLRNDSLLTDQPQVTGFTQPESGTVISMEPNGDFTYQPAQDFNGQVTFDYVITDADGEFDSARVTITIEPVSDSSPIAVDDAYETDEDVSVSGNVFLGQDGEGTDDIGQDDLDRLEVVEMPSEGTLEFDGSNGAFTYTPGEDRYGSITFRYALFDEDGDSDEATVTILINPVDDTVPFAVNDEFVTEEDTPLIANIITNDDPGKDYPFLTELKDAPVNGTVIFTEPSLGLITYTPTEHFYGEDSFTYVLSDLEGDTSIATVTITINPVNDGDPLARDDAYSTAEDVAIDMHVMENDENLIDYPVIITAFTEPANGTLSQTSDSTFRYQPFSRFTGDDTFTYTITDYDGESSTAIVTINVSLTNFDPVIVSEPTIRTPEDDLYEYTLEITDQDSTDDYTFEGLILPEWLTFEKNSDTTALLSGTPENEHVGFHEVSLKVSDQEGGSDTQTFIIEVYNVNDNPMAIELLPSEIREGEPVGTLVGKLYTDDVDKGDVHLYEMVAGEGDEGNMSFVINGNEVRSSEIFQYEEQEVYSIRVKSTDSEGEWVEEVLTITILDVNSPPSAVSLDNQEIEENKPVGSLVGLLTAQDNDQNEVFTFALSSGDGDQDNQWFRVSGDSLLTTVSFNYEAKNQYTIRIKVTDSRNASSSKQVLVDILDVNDKPSDITLSSDTLMDEQVAGSLIGFLATIDEDVSDQHTYSLVEGDGDKDNDYFAIIGDSLVPTVAVDYDEQQEFSIRVRSTDLAGAWIEKVFVLELVPDLSLDLLIPTAFTPNQDGENDNWEIGKIAAHQSATVEIYNRLGQQVFFSEAYVNPWDGRYKGKQLPADTYYYVITLPDVDKKYKGSVMIVLE